MAWINFDNGEAGGSVRDKINTFLTSVDSFLTDNNKYSNTEKAKVTDNTTKVAGLVAPEKTPYSGLATSPTHVAGTFYYDNVEGTFKGQGPIPGVEVTIGHGMHIHVVNNSGAVIPKGTAVRHNGVAAGKVQVVKAIADSFANALIFGVTQEEIANGADGAIIIQGSLPDLNTLGYPVGVPLYLSDTVAGTLTETPPDIISQVGGSLVQDGANGVLIVSIINNTNLPTVLGGMKDQTPGNDVYNLTTTTQPLNDYLIEESVVSVVDLPTGVITLPNNGKYRANFIASLTFPSSTTTRTITYELYNVTTASVEFEYPVNIPRDATLDGTSMSYTFEATAGTEYQVRIKASTAITVTFNNIVFDIESVSIN